MQNNETEEKLDSTIKSDSLVDWKNAPTVSDLVADLEAAAPSHNEQVSKIRRFLDKLEGKLEKTIPKGRSKVQPKLNRKLAEWRYSSLEEPFLSTKDVFEIEPRTFEDVEAAEENKILLNYQLNTKIDKVAFIGEYVRTATDEGTVFVEVGWKYQKGLKEVEEEIELSPEQVQMYLISEVTKGNMTEEEALMMAQSGEPITKLVKRKKEVVLHNHPTLRVCEYDKIIIDPTCEGDIGKAQFIIVPFETSLSELKSDGSYKDLDKIFNEEGEVDLASLDDTAFYNEVSDRGGFEFKDVARRKLTAYTYFGFWDIDGKGITTPIKAVWIGKTMVKLEKLPFPDNELPFVNVSFMPVRKSTYGEPDGKLTEDNQDILGAITRGMIDIMGRGANGQVLMSKGMLDAANQRKYENGEHAYYNPGFEPKSSIHMQTFPEIPVSAMQMIQKMETDAESLTGVMAFNNGIAGQSLGNTAEAARGVLNSAAKRELSILRRLSKGMEKIGRKVMAMNAVFLSDEEVIRVTNKEFRTVKRDDLNGDFDLRVSIATAEADNNKIDKLSFMMQTGQQTMDPMEAKMVRSSIYKLQKMPELAEQVMNYQPEPDPMQVRMQELALEKAELENAKMKAEIAERQSRAQENVIDMDLKKGKAANEWAKAGMTKSQKDLADLDFLERDSGVMHSRDMEKEAFKARENRNKQDSDVALKLTEQASRVAI